ncbi:AsmA family protein [Porticoccus sp. W117]|uniref:AsmA family protein n=1 Tax=Porticoccus sp. W117 TaxID=3054777 RepID=UPI00259521A3|nr:AsmA family protein [Porticoccus sp. W117]MDM3871827.1 AsmA family protein [Porticoccus sp. W117]
MKALLKWTLGLALGAVALALIAAAILLFVVDPNQYKPQLQQLAKDNQINLAIDGDLSWQLWPDVAISAADTRVSGANLPDIQVARADLALELASLIKGELVVQKVTIDQPLIRLELTDSNASQQAGAIAAAPIATAGNSEPGSPFAIHSLHINNGTLELLENGVLQQRIGNLNIAGQSINLNNTPFPIDMAFTTGLPGVAENVQLQLSGQVSNNNLQQVALNDGNINLNITSQTYGDHQINGQISAQLDLSKDQLSLPNVNLQLDGIPLSLSAVIDQLSQTPKVTGTIDLPPFNPAPLLASLSTESSAPNIERLGLKGDFSVTAEQYQLDNLALTLDDFALSGSLSATLSQQRHIKGLFKGTTLNLDNYTSGDDSTEQTNSQALFAPLLAPLALLQGGRGQIEITLEKLIAQGVELDNVQINSFGNGQVLEVANASANGFGGTLKSNARIDLSQPQPQLTFAVDSKGIDLGAALTTVADFSELSGRGDLQFSGTTQGNNSEALGANLRGNGQFALNNALYSATNIEQQLCAVAGDKDQQPESWPKGTRLNTTAGRFALNGDTLTLNSVSSGVGNVALRGQGDLQMQQGLMDMRLVFNINGATSSEQGCVLRSKSIQNRDIPLHLKGPVADINSVVTNALVDLMARTLIESKTNRLLDKLLGTDEQPVEGEQANEDAPPKDSKDQLKDLLKDLLKKR